MNWNIDLIQTKIANKALDDIIVNAINPIWSNKKGLNVNSIFDYPKEDKKRNDVGSDIIETGLTNFTITGRLEIKNVLLNSTIMTKKKKKTYQESLKSITLGTIESNSPTLLLLPYPYICETKNRAKNSKNTKTLMFLSKKKLNY